MALELLYAAASGGVGALLSPFGVIGWLLLGYGFYTGYAGETERWNRYSRTGIYFLAGVMLVGGALSAWALSFA